MPPATLEGIDKTPPDFRIPAEPALERFFKKPVRRTLYPIWRFGCTRFLSRRFKKRLPFPVDNWLWGQRGSDFQAQRRRVNRYSPLRNSRILIAGCGTGRDVASWLPYGPSEIVAVDYFNYARAWTDLQRAHRTSLRNTSLTFLQADLADLSACADASFDVVASDALFEHVADLPTVLKEFYRVLGPAGLVYATFGPLWFSWHGDHISGYDGLSSGFNHLLLNEPDYLAYIDRLGEFRHSEHDGRTWRQQGLFSYLRPSEYVECLESARFNREYVGIIIEPNAVQCLREYPAHRAQLLAQHDEMDLIVTGMTIIYKKTDTPSARHHVLPQPICNL